jgi:hypothetical protein
VPQRSGVSLVVGASTVAAIVTATALATPPSGLRSAIISAGETQRSVHYVTTLSSGSTATFVDFIGDAGSLIGRQQITYRKGRVAGAMTVIATAATAYLRGDAFALVNVMHFPGAVASKYADHWMSIAKGCSTFSSVALDVRLGSLMSGLGPSLDLRAAPRRQLDDESVIGVTGRVASSGSGSSIDETVYGRAAGPPLPVEELESSGTTRSVTTFSAWNEKLAFSVPSGATPVNDVLSGYC